MFHKIQDFNEKILILSLIFMKFSDTLNAREEVGNDRYICGNVVVHTRVTLLNFRDSLGRFQSSDKQIMCERDI